mmetsp:Transcript_57653/g.137121  ORF Transcript_57653/g.137121 Transcript_57653/m.137121 type:complete len:781 (+) Transcript_57653:107-2449(+)|eukprot:CAMPEP_0178389876 /NCGR_PEP_ID=MMETSP0689_2-20121128/10354_1 /TAXON_ID=160604 /ORGANISM="Amphidinium massartii, Strain CS-259" /LENGTH=780 /DNA_ID=CAMNT_0020010363 /DNA_START=14 /DNA_END=2356 /DNA_ORIENTATION=-
MRVRHLQTHLSEQQMIRRENMKMLMGSRVGIDAVYWLRSIQALKDPFADALGGVPPGIFGFVDRELEHFRKWSITPIFIFQGMVPGPQHSMFVNRMDHHMEAAWSHLARGQKNDAQKCFAVSTSRINSDFVNFIFHHLKLRGCEVLQAPYFAGAQLAHFAEHNVVTAVFGPPGLLLYGVRQVVIELDFNHQNFQWVDLDAILKKWQLTKDQFVEACLLAGTEYCLTYPFLNGAPAMPQGSRFNFDAAVYMIKQAPLINWMSTFPNEEMRNDHVEGYCICKVLVRSSPVLHYSDNTVKPLSSDPVTLGQPLQVPGDFNGIIGEKLPNSLYFLMVCGLISNKLPQALAKGEWVDKTPPLVDSVEFRNLITDLQDYRQRALGLVARHLHSGLYRKTIVCKAFWDSSQRGGPGGTDQAVLQPRKLKRGLRWRITKESVEAEMRRQNVDKIDFRFCLRWHANEFEQEGQFYKDITKFGDPIVTNDQGSIAAVVHFMLLEHLELIADDGGATVLGNVLKDSPRHLQEPCLIALEMMKFGCLNGDPFEAAQAERPFPEPVKYPKAPVDPRTKAVLLLSRVMSLVPMNLANEMWNADVNFDLAAFHSLVRILKRALRQLTEAALASVLLKDLDRVKQLPLGVLCASPHKEDHLSNQALLPTFMLPRACMGIVCQFFLQFHGNPGEFSKELRDRFPCCLQPKEDLKTAMLFWEDLRRCVDEIAEPLGAGELAEDMKNASMLLESQQQRLGVFPTPQSLRGDEHPRVIQAAHKFTGMVQPNPGQGYRGGW